MKKRPAHFRQDSPRDQFRTLLGSAKGSLLNLEEGINPEASAEALHKRLDDLAGLVEMLSDRLDSWPDEGE